MRWPQAFASRQVARTHQRFGQLNRPNDLILDTIQDRDYSLRSTSREPSVQPIGEKLLRTSTGLPSAAALPSSVANRKAVSSSVPMPRHLRQILNALYQTDSLHMGNCSERVR